MTKLLRAWSAFSVEGGPSGGSLTVPVEIEVAGTVLDLRGELAAEATKSLWAASDASPADFDYLWFEADQDCQLEITVDTNNGVGDEILCIKVFANQPFQLIQDSAYANYTANFAAGTLDVIDRIRVKNLSTEDAAAYRFTLIT